MDFTREPIIETVITPKEGCTLVVRSSKSSGQEEHFVDAIEVVVFGNAIFFRSLERPKAFLVPASDYEVLEVRETRLVLKNVGLDRSIKIAGGREAPLRTGRELTNGKTDRVITHSDKMSPSSTLPSETHFQEPPTGALVGPAGPAEESVEGRVDKKRDRRRNYRRRRGKDEDGIKSQEDGESADLRDPDNLSVELPPPHLTKAEIEASASSVPVAAVLSSLLAPPPNLISETIARYKDNVLFKGAFFSKEEGDESGSEDVQKNVEDESEDSGHVDVAEEEFYHLPEVEESVEEIKVPSMTLDYPEYGSSSGFHSCEEELTQKSEELSEHLLTEEQLDFQEEVEDNFQEFSDGDSIPLLVEDEEEKQFTEDKSPQVSSKKRKKAEEEKGQEEAVDPSIT
ncbi:MAG: hypothetical protein H0T62_09085 [Parachlamydiaceae bacterium]|nr:hypothetical protein [Parachlamydiaceae bacterium]